MTGIIINPAAVLATAPVSRFAVCESFGNADDVLFVLPSRSIAAGPRRATSCLNAFNEVKYSADPNPVRSAEGSVPRHRLRMGFGEERIVRIVATRDAVRLDCCWTRVLSRSAGWRRMEEVRPDARPAAKWKGVLDAAKF